jgi:MYXO-CTERM domain-containing protein
MTNNEMSTRESATMSRPPQQSKVLALLSAGVFFSLLLATGSASAAEYYVSPTGSDSNAGTQASPFATLQKANNSASGGDTIWMRAGTYNTTGQITLSKGGSSDTNRTKIWAYPGEVPVIDFSNYSLASSAADNPAITVTGSWMHLKGLEIANGKVGSSGSHSYSMLRTKGASNNTFELLNIHHGFGPGLFIDTGNGGNLILNCDSHDNYDKDGSQGDGQNGDGFGVHYQTSGPSTIIRGCRTWVTSDDGYDFIYQEVPVTIENSWAIQAGYANGGSTSPGSGNGNGFKIGSSGNGIRHIVRNNVAWKNKAAGFYANHSSGGNTWYNNTSYSNGTQYNMLASSFAADGRTIATAVIILSGSKVHIMRNNIGFPNKNSNMDGVDTASNSWDLGITPAASDFASISDTGCTGPREADGSMPSACAMLKLTAGSKMIDKGVGVGLPFAGTAPDLGAYEYGAATTTGGTSGGSGGSTGAGGSVGSGGNTSGGGSTRSGGSTVVGGSTRNGGSTGIVGSTGTGGRTGSGGSTVIGGGVVAGGSTGVGGSIGAAGSTGIGGAPTAGMIGATAGASSAGGSVATVTGGAVGGIIATGGASQGAAGIAVTGGTSNEGGAGAGGVTGPSATGGSPGETATAASGCGCVVGSRSPRSGMAAFLTLGALALLVRRRRNRS